MGKKVLITGGSGFIGQAIVNKFATFCDVIVVDKLKESIVPEKVVYYQIDLANFKNVELLSEFIDSETVVIHLAALIGGVKYFNKFPYDIIEENSLIDSTVFSACAMSKPKKVILFSSSMVYESAPLKIPFEEDLVSKIPPPITAYGFSKLKTEKFAESLFEQEGVPYLILRPFNAIGVNDLPGLYGHVIPEFVLKSLKKQSPFSIIGDGKQLRSFIHVDDIADACELLFNLDINNEAFNIGSNKPMEIIDLARLIWKNINNSELDNVIYTEAPPRDVGYRCPNVDKISKLGWVPKHNLADSINEVTCWLKESVGDYDINTAKHYTKIISKAELNYWYCEFGFKISEISDMFDIGIGTIWRLLKEYKIKFRHKKCVREYFLSSNLLKYLYCEKKKSNYDIAKILHRDIRVINTHLIKYGIETKQKLKFDAHSMQMKKVWSDINNREKRLQSYMVSNKKRPNNLEILFNSITPDNVRYTGNGSRWIQLSNKAKNPDFDVIDQKHIVFELFGDYWHKDDDPDLLVKEYESKGIKCMIIWEHELYENPYVVSKNVTKFINYYTMG